MNNPRKHLQLESLVQDGIPQERGQKQQKKNISFMMSLKNEKRK